VDSSIEGQRGFVRDAGHRRVAMIGDWLLLPSPQEADV
jgi:hypothetical protein